MIGPDIGDGVFPQSIEKSKETIDGEKKCCATNEKIRPADIHGVVVEITPKSCLQAFCHHNTRPDPHLARFGTV
jgi:hypothetical protein